MQFIANGSFKLKYTVIVVIHCYSSLLFFLSAMCQWVFMESCSICASAELKKKSSSLCKAAWSTSTCSAAFSLFCMFFIHVFSFAFWLAASFLLVLWVFASIFLRFCCNICSVSGFWVQYLCFHFFTSLHCNRVFGVHYLSLQYYIWHLPFWLHTRVNVTKWQHENTGLFCEAACMPSEFKKKPVMTDARLAVDTAIVY